MPFSIDQLEALALDLKSKRGGGLEVAVAERMTRDAPNGRVVFACYAGGGRTPYTAASLLLQAIGRRSEKITDIVTTQADRLEMGTGMYQMMYMTSDYHVISAAGSTVPVPAAPLQELAGSPVIDRQSLQDFQIPNLSRLEAAKGGDGDNPENVHRIYMLAAYALLQKQKTGDVGDGLQVAAVMVNKQGAIVACGINTNKENCTYHAEVNMLQSLFKRNNANLMPPGARIYTTLQPCQMCAGMIYNCRNRESADPLVFYGQIDPGQLRKGTALSSAHLEKLLSHNQQISHLDERGYERARSAGGPKAVKLFYKEKDAPIADFSKDLEERERNFQGTAASFGERINVNAVLYTLQRKFLRNSSPQSYSMNNKQVNPYVLRAVTHVVEFLKSKSIILPAIERYEVQAGEKWGWPARA